MQKRKAVFIIATCLVCAMLIAVCLYYVPTKSTPIDLTLNALKTDRDGNELGTVQITVSGTLTEYLFRDDRLSLQISPFEDLYDIELWGTDDSDSTNIGQPDAYGYYTFDCTASSTEIGEDTYVLVVYFREDLSKWEFFRSYWLGTNKEFGRDYYYDLNFAYRASVE